MKEIKTAILFGLLISLGVFGGFIYVDYPPNKLALSYGGAIALIVGTISGLVALASNCRPSTSQEQQSESFDQRND